ncbi:MAG: DUF362 domain-containing protein [Proteobacteria bacterium]|nr:DUF362 domain-containing protein [Pseudomonadota bacterium]
MANEESKTNRRTFLKRSVVGSIGTAAGISTLTGCDNVFETVYPLFLGGGETDPKETTPMGIVDSDVHSKLSVVYSPHAINSSGEISQTIVQKMFDRAIYSFTGKSTLEEAWNDIIPDLKPSDTIGIKVNCINPPLASHPEVVYAIINHLVKLGINKDNIIVWDRGNTWIMGIGNLSKSGYKTNNEGKGVKYTATSFDDFGYDDNIVANIPSRDLNLSVSKIVSKECKYLINVPVLKNHKRAGVTQCMKNYFGAIPLLDTLSFHSRTKMHENNCNPTIPELYNNPIFKDKTKLHVCDALLTLYEGGPFGEPQTTIGKIMVGKDPVALDYLGVMIIEEQRKKNGYGTILAKAKYIQTAAEMGLGTNNPKQMDVDKVTI